jgi:hypothetical protein
VTVMDAFEGGMLDLPDFYFTGDDYRYRFEPEAKQRFLSLLRERFNCGISYRGRALKWDTVIEQKANELGRFLLGKSILDLTEPSPRLLRHDDRELRERILTLTQSKATRLGIPKSTLHYLRKNATASKPLTVYRPVMERITS